MDDVTRSLSFFPSKKRNATITFSIVFQKEDENIEIESGRPEAFLISIAIHEDAMEMMESSFGQCIGEETITKIKTKVHLTKFNRNKILKEACISAGAHIGTSMRLFANSWQSLSALGELLIKPFEIDCLCRLCVRVRVFGCSLEQKEYFGFIMEKT
jgi:hypothetical protein